MDVGVMRTVIGKLTDSQLTELDLLVQSEISSRKPSPVVDNGFETEDTAENSATAS